MLAITQSHSIPHTHTHTLSHVHSPADTETLRRHASRSTGPGMRHARMRSRPQTIGRQKTSSPFDQERIRIHRALVVHNAAQPQATIQPTDATEARSNMPFGPRSRKCLCWRVHWKSARLDGRVSVRVSVCVCVCVWHGATVR